MENLKHKLQELCTTHGLAALKGGTEVEDMSFNEIAHIKELAGTRLPVIVKIGGPEARNDMRAMKAMGIDGILAPMIESEYALKNFVQTIGEIYRGSDTPYLAINIETVTAYNNIEVITSSPFFQNIRQVTIGRSDLSASMELKNDDEEVTRATQRIIALSKEKGKITSVGGKITPKNAPMIERDIRPDFINTRNLVFNLRSCHDIAAAIHHGLEFEIELYRAWTHIEPGKKSEYQTLICNTLERMSPAERAHSGNMTRSAVTNQFHL